MEIEFTQFGGKSRATFSRGGTMEALCLHKGGPGAKSVPQLFFYLSWLLFFLLLHNAVSAAAGEGVGKITAVEGSVDVLRGGALPAVALKAGDSVSVGDVVRTKSDARVEIVFEDGTVLRVAPQSRIDISEYGGGARGRSCCPVGSCRRW
ncbi:MAG: FecR domain-containing protein [Thermodesulfovibrionales bacterium]